MSGISGLKSRIGRCGRIVHVLHRKPKQSIVFIGRDGTLLWEEGVEYNEGVLAVPLPMSVEEWEQL